MRCISPEASVRSRADWSLCRRLDARCRDAEGCGEGQEVRICQLSLICLLIRGPLQIADHPKRIIVDDNKWKANIVAHARGQFLCRVKKTPIAD